MEPETRLSINEHLFVKVYMEGFPIGRKVDLRAYDSYKKLSVAIDELFGGLVAGNFHTRNKSLSLLTFTRYAFLLYS